MLTYGLSLSEIMEKCGEFILFSQNKEIKRKNWLVLKENGVNEKGSILFLEGIGATPEEALANLYLEIQNDRTKKLQSSC